MNVSFWILLWTVKLDPQVIVSICDLSETLNTEARLSGEEIYIYYNNCLDYSRDDIDEKYFAYHKTPEDAYRLKSNKELPLILCN